jgi:hypothetical protein
VVHDITGKAEEGWQILLATSWDAVSLKKRGFKTRVDDAAEREKIPRV